MSKKKTKLTATRIASIVLFALVMIVGLVLGLSMGKRPKVSMEEKRELTKFPQFALEKFFDGEYFSQVSLWYSDTYPMRDQFIKSEQKIQELYGFHMSTMMVGEAVVADDIPDIPTASTEQFDDISDEGNASTTEGENTESNGEIDYSNEVHPAELPDSIAMEAEIQKQIQQNVYVHDGAAYTAYYFDLAAAQIYTDAINQIADELKGKTEVYSILVPNNSGAMLPDDELKALGGSDQNQAIDYYNSLCYPYVHTSNVYPDFREHNDEYLYFRTDHHWTQLGAYYAYLHFCEEKGVEPEKLEDFETMTFEPFLGSFYASLHNQEMENNPDSITAYIPNDTNDLVFYDANGAATEWHVIADVTGWSQSALYSCFIGGDNPLTIIENPNINDGSSCVVLKESYANCFVPFLVDHYQTVHVIDFRYTTVNVKDYVVENEIDDLILMNNITIISSEGVANSIANLLK